MELKDSNVHERSGVPGAKHLVLTGTGDRKSSSNSTFVTIPASLSDLFFMLGFSGAARASLRQQVEELGAR